MSAAETIAAAIEKLEGQRDAYYAECEEVWRAEHREGFASRVFNQDDLLIAGDVSAIDADLIVTLHRTIDPVLAILRTAHADADGSHDEPGAFNNAAQLARAILGEVTS